MDEVLMIYLYGIWDSIEALLIISVIIVTGITLTTVIVYMVNKDDIEIYSSEDIIKNAKANMEKSKKFMYTKTSILLIILAILFPTKEIAVAMFAAKPTIQLVKDVADSNRTAKLVDIFDLSLEKIASKLKKK